MWEQGIIRETAVLFQKGSKPRVILFNCDVCGQQLYFESSSCTQCHSPLGYLLEHRALSALREEARDDESGVVSWVALAPIAEGRRFRSCKNAAIGACNWLVPADSDSVYCVACALSETIPNLSEAKRREAWTKLEAAKRRLLFTLQALDLPIESKLEAPERGMAFRFLKGTGGAPVTTGHAQGIITINVDEADPAFLANEQERFGEAYRTTLGHFRHEVGHYYFDRLVAESPLIEEFRELFGDERVDYQQALARHYEAGPRPDWVENFISAYASSHPWEDWAETWAHYLHMVDTLETARSYGLAVSAPSEDGGEGRIVARSLNFEDFDALMDAWHPVSLALNGLNRSMGLPDAYPFSVSPPVREKLAFVHRVIRRR